MGAVTVQVAGKAGVPVGATAAWLNVTAVAPTAGGSLTLQPGACAGPIRTITVSVARGRAAAAAALVPLVGGKVCVRVVGGPLHIVMDLSGWFGGPTTNGLAYVPERPARVFSTAVSGTLAANAWHSSPRAPTRC